MRIKVVVRYPSPNEVHLVALEETIMYCTATEGQPIYSLREGDTFRVDNQMRPWKCIRRGKYLALAHDTFCPEGRVLYPNTVGLLALSSGSARRGVLHPYREPKNVLEEMLEKNGQPKSVIKYVDNIDITTEYGGTLCSHRTRAAYWYDAISDCSKEHLEEIPQVARHSNQYHIGCPDGAGKVRYFEGTYLILYKERKSEWGLIEANILEILLTQKADLEMVANGVEKIMKP